jgi:hypothetical protein
MGLQRSLARLWRLRSAIRALQGIEAQLAQQTQLLTRLADQVAPVPPAEETDVDRPRVAQPSLSFLDAEEIAGVQAFQTRFVLAVGRPPSDDETLEFLAERAERTQPGRRES